MNPCLKAPPKAVAGKADFCISPRINAKSGAMHTIDSMNFEEKVQRLREIYDEFERRAQPFNEKAVCRPGCAFCCTHYGHLDITTLEGWVIQKQLQRMGRAKRNQVRKDIVRNMRRKEAGRSAKCPFLNPNDTCSIYDGRPFSCRQLYSLKICGETGPLVHRRVHGLAEATVRALQELDDNGYSGHMSYILHLLEVSAFKNDYLQGNFNPAGIKSFGQTHGLLINRIACRAHPKAQAV